MKLTLITTPLFHLAFIMSIVLGHEDESKSDNVFLRIKLTDGLTDSEKQAMLDKHNELRSTVANGDEADQPSATDMRKMYWSDELASVAQNYADQCIFEHNPNKRNEQNTFTTVGENLFVTTGSFNPTGSIQSWYNEVANYGYSDRSCSGVCGHYTQVVWNKSYSLGCGAKRCAQLDKGNGDGSFWANGLIVVCNYGPAGNFPRKPYTSGTTGADCSSDSMFPNEENGLCAAIPTPYPSRTPSSSPSDSPSSLPSYSPSSLPSDSPSSWPSDSPSHGPSSVKESDNDENGGGSNSTSPISDLLDMIPEEILDMIPEDVIAFITSIPGVSAVFSAVFAIFG